jgi:hypothetical protein
MGEWRCNSTILDLGTTQRCEVSFKSSLLYSRTKIPHKSSYSRLDVS